MSNSIRKAYHPGSYLKDYLDEAQLTQDEFAKRLGITSKQVSLLLKQEANITPDIAYKLSSLMGTSTEFWLNLQARFDAYIMALQAESKLNAEKEVYKLIDKKFLKDVGVISDKETIENGISKLRQYSMVSNLTILKEQDFCSQFRQSIKQDENEKNIVCKNVWVSLASKLANQQEVSPFNERKLINLIPYFRCLTLLRPNEFFPKLKKSLNECGVAFLVLPTLTNSNINGVVKWLDSDKVMLAMNDRGKTNDKFWFSFFHELKHVLQKSKRYPIYGFENCSIKEYEDFEKEADEFSKETLISTDALNSLIYVNKSNILAFAKKQQIAPGIVVGRLQKEGRLKWNVFNDLKEKCVVVKQTN